VLLVKCGSTAAAVRRVHGDYDRWFLRALAPTGPALRVVEPHAGAPLPARAGGADAIVLTGSPSSVTDRAPWMARTAAWALEQAERLPVLGVCFGHQLLADACGGSVGRNPLGRELGTVRCALTPEGLADPLFEGVPAAFEIAATHEDEVRRLPAGAVLLATNAWSRVQAFRIGPRVRAVQFHPELDAPALAATVAARAEHVVAEAEARGEAGGGRLRAVRAGIRASPWGARILGNFVRMACPAAGPSPRPAPRRAAATPRPSGSRPA
jgi:GMP synthase (glutamine-hydrolysing)